jgi:hypothetical protein
MDHLYARWEVEPARQLAEQNISTGAQHSRESEPKRLMKDGDLQQRAPAGTATLL